ncbi:MAG: autotransporter assembly complex protein TamA [Caulobacteraceae bacterium]|nr:autotransporter assembly complex protein TamA [Caulobacteraceae bacterium]
MRFVLAGLAALTAALAAAPAWAEPKARVEGVEDEELKARIERAIGESKDAPETRMQARRRAADAAQDAIAALRSEGYYGYTVEPDVSDGEPPVPVVRVTPGPQFTIANPTVTFQPLEPSPDAAAISRDAMGLQPGQAGRAADVIAAEGRAVAALTMRGYADAAPGERQVLVDHSDQTVRPNFMIDPGGLVRMDGLRVTTEGRTNPRWVAQLAPWDTGDVYDPEDVAELERRLLDTGVYDSVTVALAPRNQTTPEGYRPVVISLADRPKSTLEAGASYSTSEGAGVDLIWNRYNRLGRADTLTFEAHYAEILSRVLARLSLPHFERPAQTLSLSLEGVQELTDAYDRTALLLRGDFKQRFEKTSFYTYGLLIDVGRSAERVIDPNTNQAVKLSRDLAVLSAPVGLTLDRSDDPLDPHRGWRVQVELQPAATFGDEQLWFFRAQAQGTMYVPLGESGRTVVAGRLRLGSIVNGSVPDVPPAYRFYAGGGGSVRGYEYQGIGPRLPDSDKPLGGPSLVEASIELRQQLWGDWGGVLFFDAGSVGDNPTPDFSIVNTSVGAGVRYKLPFGPIRADFAVPLDRSHGQPSFQVYVSLGQAF